MSEFTVGERKWDPVAKAKRYPDIHITLQYHAIHIWYNLFKYGFKPKTDAEKIVIKSVIKTLKEHIELQQTTDPDYWGRITLTWDEVEFSVIQSMTSHISMNLRRNKKHVEGYDDERAPIYAQIDMHIRTNGGYDHSKSKNNLSTITPDNETVNNWVKERMPKTVNEPLGLYEDEDDNVREYQNKDDSFISIIVLIVIFFVLAKSCTGA